MVTRSDLVRVSEFVWEVPRSYRSDMNVPARIYSSEKMLEMAFRDKTMEQLINTAAMPGVVKRVLVMPDAHQGYGPPIGGVVPTRYPHGVISPGLLAMISIAASVSCAQSWWPKRSGRRWML